MQLPGLITNMVRVRCEVTWSPPSDTYSVAWELLEEDPDTGGWSTQAAWTTGTPVHPGDYRTRAREVLAHLLAEMESLRAVHNFPPFP